MSSAQTRDRLAVELANLFIARENHKPMTQRIALQLRLIKSLTASSPTFESFVLGDPSLPRCEHRRFDIDAMEILGDLALLTKFALFERVEVPSQPSPTHLLRDAPSLQNFEFVFRRATFRGHSSPEIQTLRDEQRCAALFSDRQIAPFIESSTDIEFEMLSMRELLGVSQSLRA